LSSIKRMSSRPTKPVRPAAGPSRAVGARPARKKAAPSDESESESSSDSEVERLATAHGGGRKPGNATDAQIKAAEERGAVEAELRAAQAAQVAVEHAVQQAHTSMRDEMAAFEARAAETGTALAEATKRVASLEQQLSQADDAFVEQRAKLDAVSAELSAVRAAHDAHLDAATSSGASLAALQEDKAALERSGAEALARAVRAEAGLEELELAILKARDICETKETELLAAVVRQGAAVVEARREAEQRLGELHGTQLRAATDEAAAEAEARVRRELAHVEKRVVEAERLSAERLETLTAQAVEEAEASDRAASLRQREAVRAALEVAARAQQRAMEAAAKAGAAEAAAEAQARLHVALKNAEEEAARGEALAVKAALRKAGEQAAAARKEAAAAAEAATARAVEAAVKAAEAGRRADEDRYEKAGRAMAAAQAAKGDERAARAAELAHMQDAIRSAVRGTEQERAQQARSGKAASEMPSRAAAIHAEAVKQALSVEDRQAE